MNLKSDIGNGFTRKAICINLILFVSISFSFSCVRADSCRGGTDCLICTHQLHRHLPGAQTRMGNPGCTPAGQNSTCGFEAAQGAEKFYGIASTVRSFHPVRSGIFSGAYGEDGQFHLFRGLIAPFFSPESGPKAPIYLRNHSLLC
jgi:hypothetical protein